MLEELEIRGCVFKISATDQTGFHTGRPRWRVFCVSHDVLVHPATTGPENLAEMHVYEAEHGRVTPWPGSEE